MEYGRFYIGNDFALQQPAIKVTLPCLLVTNMQNVKVKTINKGRESHVGPRVLIAINHAGKKYKM